MYGRFMRVGFATSLSSGCGEKSIGKGSTSFFVKDNDMRKVGWRLHWKGGGCQNKWGTGVGLSLLLFPSGEE
ncbi:Hypothetical predicted protein, partial [Prunus dulcis]